MPEKPISGVRCRLVLSTEAGEDAVVNHPNKMWPCLARRCPPLLLFASRHLHAAHLYPLSESLPHLFPVPLGC